MSARVQKALFKFSKELLTLKSLDKTSSTDKEIQERCRLLRRTRKCLFKVRRHFRLLGNNVADVAAVGFKEEEDDDDDDVREVESMLEDGYTDEEDQPGDGKNDDDAHGYDSKQVLLNNIPEKDVNIAATLKRFGDCFSTIDDLEYPINHLLDRILHGEPGPLRKQEDSAFQHLCIRYLSPENHVLVSTEWMDALLCPTFPPPMSQDATFGPFAESTGWGDIRRQILDTERVGNLEERMIARETVMFAVWGGNTIEAWVFSVIETINCLILALEWNDLTNVVGGKKLKTALRSRMFDAIRPGVTAGTGQHSRGGASAKALNSQKNKFFRMHRRIVTSRNHTLRLYEMFGATVVIERVFNPMSGLVARGRTPAFSHLLQYTIEHFRQRIEEAGILKPEGDEHMDAAYRRYMEHGHNSAINMLQCVLSRFATTGLKDWVVGFFAKHPPNYMGQVTKVVDD